MSSQSSGTLLKCYIKTMAQNSLQDKDEVNPLNIDLVISGGAFNGAYAYGVVLYLLELVEQKKLVIHNVSGCSIGAVCALCTICDNLDPAFLKSWCNMKNDFRDNQKLSYIKTFIKECVNSCIKDEDLSKINNRLFITKTDMSSGQHIVKSNWSSKKELEEDLICSSFLPYLIDGSSRYKNQYVDGIHPHIFKNVDRKCMYIDLHSSYNNRWVKSIFTASEKNPDQRVLEGLQECSKFLNNEHSYLCSWVHKWNIWSYAIIRLQFIIVYSFLILVEYINTINLPDQIKTNRLYKGIIDSLTKLAQDSFYLGQY